MGMRRRFVYASLQGLLLILGFIVITACPTTALASTDGHPVVVSFGDSYSSGEGTPDFYDHEYLESGEYDKLYSKEHEFLAHRSEQAWPGQLVVNDITLKDMKDKGGWFFLAVSGAVTENILKTDEHGKETKGEHYKEYGQSKNSSGDWGKEWLPAQIDVLNKLVEDGKLRRDDIDYVTITMGGNDVGFQDVVTTSILNGLAEPMMWLQNMNPMSFISGAYYHDHWLSKGILETKLLLSVDHFNTITRGRLLQTYQTLDDLCGANEQILVAGYPHLFPRQGSRIDLGVSWIPSFITDLLFAKWISVSPDDSYLINNAVDVFDEGIGYTIRESRMQNLHYVDVRDEFEKPGDWRVNPIYFFPQSQDIKAAPPSAYSVHPNLDGQKAYANAVQAKIDEIEANKTARDVDIESDVAMSLVFDVSGSMDDASAMSGMSKLDSAKRQSSDFVSSVSGAKSGEGGLSVRVGVCSFASSAETNRGLSNNPEDINASIYSLNAGGQTNMYAGLNEGINQLMGEDGPRLMVFLSDGLSNKGGSRSDILSLAQEAADNKIKIYTIGFGSSYDIDESLLQEIASITGGEYSHEDSANISSAAVGLFATMMNARLQAQYDVLNSSVGVVGQDATSDAGTFDITKNGTVQVYLYWPGSMLDMQLTDPDGTEVAEGYAGYTIDTSTIPTSITIQNAKQGTWNMSVYGREVSMVEEPFYAVAAFEETEEPAPEVAMGAAAQDSGTGLLVLVAVAFVGCLLGVYALSMRRR